MIDSNPDGVVAVGYVSANDKKGVLHVLFRGEHRRMTVTRERAEEELTKGVPLYYDRKRSYSL